MSIHYVYIYHFIYILGQKFLKYYKMIEVWIKKVLFFASKIN